MESLVNKESYELKDFNFSVGSFASADPAASVNARIQQHGDMILLYVHIEGSSPYVEGTPIGTITGVTLPNDISVLPCTVIDVNDNVGFGTVEIGTSGSVVLTDIGSMSSAAHVHISGVI